MKAGWIASAVLCTCRLSVGVTAAAGEGGWLAAAICRDNWPTCDRSPAALPQAKTNAPPVAVAAGTGSTTVACDPSGGHGVTAVKHHSVCWRDRLVGIVLEGSLVVQGLVKDSVLEGVQN